tara:strand:- start:9257 stop:9475 length:219 start_codon:yes stop_codon:yes gene_type:complete
MTLTRTNKTEVLATGVCLGEPDVIHVVTSEGDPIPLSSFRCDDNLLSFLDAFDILPVSEIREAASKKLEEGS